MAQSLRDQGKTSRDQEFKFSTVRNFDRQVLNLVLPGVLIQPFTLAYLVLTLRMCFNNFFFLVKYTDLDVLRTKYSVETNIE